MVFRPDGHVGIAVRLVEGNGTVEALEGYFKGFTTQNSQTRSESGLGGGEEHVRAQL